MSPRRFDGWEPAEVHEHHYDADGRLTHTVVTREPEWSAEDRDQVEALVLAEQLTCHGCGSWLPHSTDSTFVGLVDTSTCGGCRSMAIMQRDAQRKHKGEHEPSPGRPGWADGLRWHVRPATAGEIERAVRPE